MEGVYSTECRPLTVVVIGPGLMGSQIGIEYALGGHRVVFVARHLDRARQRVAQAFDLVETLGLAGSEAVAEARERVTIAEDLEQAGPQADLVVESIAEDLGQKGPVLSAAAELYPGAVIASNTSGIPITALGEAAGAPGRIVGTHYWNPPLLMPLVEVIAGEETDPAVIEFAVTTLRSLGKRPMVVTKDVPGFVWNRLQMALLREAVYLAETGVADPATIDEIVRDGLARRWTLTGPFETVALGGVPTFEAVSANLLPHLSPAQRLTDLARFAYHDEAALRAVRERRDRGLLEALRRDRAGEDG